MSLSPPAAGPLTLDTASVDAAISSRMSVRAFLPTPVPRERIAHLLALASRAPSGSNTQPWKAYVLQGRSRDELVDKVCAAHDAEAADPALAATRRPTYDYYPSRWFSPYIERRRENGWGLYGLLGIAKGEQQRMHEQHQRNFRFFDAPVGLLFTVDSRLGRGALMDCGMFLQNLMVAARGQGLDTCPQAAWAYYADIVMPHLGAAEHELLLCGVALGHADLTAPVNRFHTPREPVQGFTTWLD